MLFVGNIAVPDKKHTNGLANCLMHHHNIFANKTFICNFEGLINDGNVDLNIPVLYNHSQVVKAITDNREVVDCLANNHILDLTESYTATIDTFISSGAQCIGTGTSNDVVRKPAILYEGDQKVLIFNACWDFLLYNQKKS